MKNKNTFVPGDTIQLILFRGITSCCVFAWTIISLLNSIKFDQTNWRMEYSEFSVDQIIRWFIWKCSIISGSILWFFLIMGSSYGRRPSKTSPPPNPCESMPTDTFVPNPKGCKYMYHCRDGQSFEAFCPGDMWFNPDSGICDYRENVVCHLDDAKAAKNPKEFIVCPTKDSREPNFKASSVDCGRYYLCYHGKAIQRHCASDLQWNDDKKLCDMAKRVNCRVSHHCVKCLPHLTKSNIYLLCRSNRTYPTVRQPVECSSRMQANAIILCFVKMGMPRYNNVRSSITGT